MAWLLIEMDFEWRWSEMRHMHLIIVSIMNALIEQLNDLMQAPFMHLKKIFLLYFTDLSVLFCEDLTS